MRPIGAPLSPIIYTLIERAGTNTNFRRQVFVVPESNSDL
jgi:hypothetical protein